MRWLAVVGEPGAGGCGVRVLALRAASFGSFVRAARIELRKIVWPTRQETGQTTLVVFGFVIVAGVFFWLLDLAAGLGDQDA